jgi:hypothetical protein
MKCGDFAIDGYWNHMAIDTIVSQMKAKLLFNQRIDYADGAIVEMVIWRVPAPVRPSIHGLKYSLF